MEWTNGHEEPRERTYHGLDAFPPSIQMSAVPVLLPFKLHVPSEDEWRPTKYLQDPQPPPIDEAKAQQELAAQQLGMDPRAVKKVKPRRTVDYGGELGRWALVSTLRTLRFVVRADILRCSFRKPDQIGHGLRTFVRLLLSSSM